MKDTIKYVGLYVSKEKIAVAIADEGRDEPSPRKASACSGNQPEKLI
ncbi:hypothetical protein [Neobacillus cucumis]|nr:hypothetical protein [Neobacillus cucumis]MBM7651816.1 hypothetical protein [Neobacillus cucumis]